MIEIVFLVGFVVFLGMVGTMLWALYRIPDVWLDNDWDDE